jgi:predicted GNAT family N-acyltransferase
MNAPVRTLTPATRVYESNSLEVTIASTLNDMMQVVALRAIVYMSEQICPFDEEFDGNDFAGSTHLIVRRFGEPVGVLRLRWFADFCKLERVAVKRDERGRAATMALIRAAIELAEQKGYRTLIGHAQERLVPFWVRQVGFKVRQGRPKFTFSDHSYVEIVRDLQPPKDALNVDADPMVLVRPEGAWDRPGVLDRSTERMATNPGAAR